MTLLLSTTRVRRLAVGSSLLAVLAARGLAQSDETRPPAPQPRVVVATSQGEPVVSVTPGEIGCRALLAEIAKVANVEVRDLARVPDDVVYVQVRDASLPDAVARVLRLAKVDYVLRGSGTGTAPWLLLIADRTAGSLQAADGTRAPAGGPPMAGTGRPALFRTSSREAARSPFGPPPEAASDVVPGVADLPAFEPAADVSVETGQVVNAPVWHPGEPLPAPVVIPPEARPRAFEFKMPAAPWPTAPAPGTQAPATTPAPSAPAPVAAPPAGESSPPPDGLARPPL